MFWFNNFLYFSVFLSFLYEFLLNLSKFYTFTKAIDELGQVLFLLIFFSLFKWIRIMGLLLVLVLMANGNKERLIDRRLK